MIHISSQSWRVKKEYAGIFFGRGLLSSFKRKERRLDRREEETTQGGCLHILGG